MKENFKSQIKEEKLVASGAVIDHSSSFTCRGCCQKNLSKSVLVSYQCPHFLSLVSLGFPETHRTTWPWVPITKPTGCRATLSAMEPPAQGYAMVGSGQQTCMAGQSLTAGSTQQQPLMGLHFANWGSTCQQLRNNGMALAHLAEWGLLWVTWLPIS